MPKQPKPPIGRDRSSPQDILYFGMHPYLVVSDDEAHVTDPDYVLSVDIFWRKGSLTTVIGSIALKLSDAKTTIETVREHLSPNGERIELTFPFTPKITHYIDERAKGIEALSRIRDTLNTKDGGPAKDSLPKLSDDKGS